MRFLGMRISYYCKVNKIGRIFYKNNMKFNFIVSVYFALPETLKHFGCLLELSVDFD